jgi:PAS domain S-box-containing protein
MVTPAILLLGVALTLVIWQYAVRREADRIRTGFLSRAQTQATVVAQHLRNYEEMVYSLRDSFLGQETVTREEFARVAQSLLNRHAGVQALEWVQIVPGAQRAAFEAAAARELNQPFVVRRRLPDNTLEPSPPAEEYFAVNYVEPRAGNEPVFGFDLRTSSFAQLMTEARHDRQMRVGPPIPLILPPGSPPESGVILILPFWRIQDPSATVEGFVLGVLRTRTMLAQAHRLTTSEALDTYYLEEAADGSPALLYANLAGTEPASLEPVPVPPLDDPADVHETLNVGGRQWRMVMRVNTAWAHRVGTLQPGTILASGLTITALLALFVNSLLQRTSRIEQEVAERTKQLRQTEIRLQDIVDHSPALIFLKDTAGRYLMCNQRFLDLSGRTRAEIVGSRDCDFHPADVADIYTANDAKVLASGRPMEFEEVGVRPDGSRVVHISHKFPLRDDQGRIYAVCGVATDITDRKAAEEHKLQYERRLLESQKLESLGVLAGGIAHDFNNILTAILGNANLASLELSDDHPIRPQLRQIELASRRASDLCAQMLAYAGKAAFITSPVNLTALVRDTAALLEATVGRRVRLELSTADKLPSVLGDATQLRQIVMNLVINAADAIGDRTDGTVEVRTFSRELAPEFFATAVQSPARPAGTYVGLEVTDNGSGMNPGILKRIFEPFFTTKFSGRGLGLAAVLGIVQSHRGALFVESTPGKGTVFRLFLPASNEAARETTQTAGGRPPALAGTVLVVDDEPAVRLVAIKALRAAGLQVIEAEDGQSALEIYRQRNTRIDLALLDLTMPGLSGEETLRQLRVLAPTLPVIVMSGYSEGETMGRCASLGVSGYLAKPFEVSDLVTRLRPYLDKLDHRSA